MAIIVLNNLCKSLIYKPAQQDVVSNTVLQDDADLVIPVDMSRRYAFDAHILFQLLGTASGYKFGISAPGDGVGTFIVRSAQVFDGVNNTIVNTQSDYVTPILISGALAVIGKHILRIKGVLQIAAGFTGDFKFQFAQNVSDAGAIRVLGGSTIEMEDYG